MELPDGDSDTSGTRIRSRYAVDQDFRGHTCPRAYLWDRRASIVHHGYCNLRAEELIYGRTSSSLHKLQRDPSGEREQFQMLMRMLHVGYPLS